MSCPNETFDVATVTPYYMSRLDNISYEKPVASLLVLSHVVS